MSTAAAWARSVVPWGPMVLLSWPLMSPLPLAQANDSTAQLLTLSPSEYRPRSPAPDREYPLYPAYRYSMAANSSRLMGSRGRKFSPSPSATWTLLAQYTASVYQTSGSTSP